MAKLKVPNSQLYTWNSELNSMSNSIWTVLLAGRIETFMQHNKDTIVRLNESIKRIQDKYLRFTDDGKDFMYELDGKTLQTLPGMLLKDYEEDMTALMNSFSTVITN